MVVRFYSIAILLRDDMVLITGGLGNLILKMLPEAHGFTDHNIKVASPFERCRSRRKFILKNRRLADV